MAFRKTVVAISKTPSIEEPEKEIKAPMTDEEVC